MKWIVSNPFILSGNLHGGSVVASYPFDDSPRASPWRSVYSKVVTICFNFLSFEIIHTWLNHIFPDPIFCLFIFWAAQEWGNPHLRRSRDWIFLYEWRSRKWRIYVPSGWKHYASDRKTLRRTFVSRGKNGCFFDRREKKQFFQRETNVLLRVFLTQA